MIKKLLLAAALVCSSSYCYSDSIVPYYGQTGNAAENGLTWGMNGVLPQNIPGLDINGVIYRYTIDKETQDSVTVNIQNEHATEPGYIFRQSDEWKPGSLAGTTINRVVPVTPSNRSLWGDGSINVEGNGTVNDPVVLYNYRVEPCFDAQFDPRCPGYEPPMPVIPEVEISLYDPLNDPNVDLIRETCNEGSISTDCEAIKEDDDDELTEEEKAEKEAKEKEEREYRLEKALSAANNSALFATALANSQLLSATNKNITSYYEKKLPGGNYEETVNLQDGRLPENRRGVRNQFAQQLLHQQMVEMQYSK